MRTPRSERLDHVIVVNSLPKSGTTLLMKALAAMPGTRPTEPGLFGRTFPEQPAGTGLPLGVDAPVWVKPDAVRRLLGQQPGGSIMLAHAGHSTALAEILSSLDARMAVIVRDPRDVAASLGPYVAKQPQHFLHARFSDLDERARIVAALEGLAAAAGAPALDDLATRYERVLAWDREDLAMVIRFEDLVGSQGGGDDDAQRSSVRSLATHVGITLAEDDVIATADGLFGGTSTFRSGRIGGWRTTWDDELRAQAAELLGPVLERLGYER